MSPYILILTKSGTKPIAKCSLDELKRAIDDARGELAARHALACGIRAVIERRVSIIESEISRRKDDGRRSD